MKKDRVIEFMKGLTILLVVIAHVSKMYTPNGAIPVNGENAILLYLTNFIYTFHMPVFVAISGMVFYICKVNHKKYDDKLAFVKNKFKRLMIPFITFLLVLVIPVMHVVNLWGGGGVGNVLLMKDLRHLWYLPTLFFILIFFNCLEPIIRKYKHISFIILLLINLVSGFFPHCFQISNVAKFLFYFYLGYLFEEWREKHNSITIQSFLIVLAFQIVCFIGITLLTGKRSFGLHSVLNVLCASSGLYIVYSLCHMISRIKSRLVSSFMAVMSRDSYGIYLFHPMIIYLLFYAIRNESYNSWLVFLIITVTALSLSMLLTRIIRKTPLRVCIGE